MEFSVFILAQQRGYHQTCQEIITNSVEQTVQAEQAGFDTAWYAEHHFNNYSLSPSPLMMVAHSAGKTSRIRLGTGVCILPLYQPLRFLAEVGLADVLSNGRLELGVGSGYQDFEFQRFGTNLADSGKLYNEMLDIIPLGLTQKVFEYHGEFIDIPPTSIAVRPVQQPLPPMWVTSGNPATLTRAVLENHALFTTALLGGRDAIQRQRDKLLQVAERAGKDLDRDVKFGFLRCAYASDNQAEIDSYLDNARFQRRISEALKFRRAETDDGYLVKEVPTDPDITLEQLRDNLPVGSVNQVIDKLLAEIELLKPKHIAVNTQLGDFSQKAMLKQVELWGEKIIPAVKKALGSEVKQAAE